MGHNIYLALGTNMGDRLSNLEAARKALQVGSSLIQASSIYETDPWGFTDQPAFLNQVVEMETDIYPPRSLLAAVKDIEKNLGREPSFHYGPRLIDIDILFFDSLVTDTPGLTIPHPQIEKRAFVLVPLAEIAPGLVHPVSGRRVDELLSCIDQQGVRLFA